MHGVIGPNVLKELSVRWTMELQLETEHMEFALRVGQELSRRTLRMEDIHVGVKA